MRKRIISVFLSAILCSGVFSPITLAKETDAYALYMEAVKNTVESGSWTEELAMTANMTITSGNAKTKTKLNVNSLMNISDYDENNLSDLQMSGSADMSVMGQSYAWNVEYEDGIAHYQYTEPNQTSADIEMDPSYFNFNTLTRDMMSNPKVSGNQITFTVPGEKMEEAGIAAVNLMSGIDDLQYGDVEVKVITNEGIGTIDTIVMNFHASLTYQGYDAEVDYTINYQFRTEMNAEGQELQNYFENSAVTDTKQINSSDNIIGEPDDLKTFCFLIGVTVIAVSLLIALVVYIGRKVHHK